MALCGLAMKLFGGGQTALLVAGSGALEVVLSSLSLKTWRAQQPAAKLFTGLEAGKAATMFSTAVGFIQVAGALRSWLLLMLGRWLCISPWAAACSVAVLCG